MSQLVQVLYPLPDVRRTPLSTLRWWESRRVVFNKVVGATGMVTLAGVSFFSLLPPSLSGGEISLVQMAMAAMAYGIAANVCYSLGWVAEMVALAAWGRSTPDLGPLLFRQGLIFSVGLTLFPVLLSAMLWVVRIAGWLVA